MAFYTDFVACNSLSDLEDMYIRDYTENILSDLPLDSSAQVLLQVTMVTDCGDVGFYAHPRTQSKSTH